MASEIFQLPRLPACEICHLRKVKCDNNRPKCASCTKNGEECVALDPASGKRIARNYIHQLEEQERALRETPIESDRRHSVPMGHPSIQSITGTEKPTEKTPSIVEGSGISFLRSLFTDGEWRESKSNADLQQNLGRYSQITDTTLKPNPLPSSEAAKVLVDDYLSRSHIQTPFLLRQEVAALFERVFLSELPLKDIETHDLYLIFMIIAIGSVSPHRNGMHDAHPFGYYLAALQYFDKNFLLNGLSAIQDLMLIARFGIYHHTGTSVWNITQLCIRMCIEQELHLPSVGQQDLLQEHLRRRVFWECYMIDRYSSLTLGRPVAIADRDIEVPFPADADDEELIAANGVVPNLTAFSASRPPQGINEMSVFFACLRLRQITSKTNAKLSQSPTVGSSLDTKTSFLIMGRVYTDLHQILNELKVWRSTTPVFERPKCLYESQEWYEFIYERDRFLAIRHAMDLVPKRNALPPQDLLSLCQKSAARVVLLFSDLYEQNRITYTRSYFQLLFTAGLSAMFCFSATSAIGQPLPHEQARALESCGEILHSMATKLPDAKHYATIFKALHRNISRKAETSTQGLSSETQPHPSYTLPGLPGLSDAIVPSVEHALLTSLHQQHTHLNDADMVQTQPMANHADISNDGYDHGQWSFPQDGDIFSGLPNQNAAQNDDVLNWAFFNDHRFWDIEAGLGEYAYGDPDANLNMFNLL